MLEAELSPVVGVEGPGPGARQADPDALQAGRSQGSEGLGPGTVRVHVDRAGFSLPPDRPNCVGQERGLGQGLALAALAEAHHGGPRPAQVVDRGLGNLLNRRGPGEARLGTWDRILLGDAAQALCVAARSGGQGGLVRAEEKVPGSAAAVVAGAVDELGHQAVAPEAAQKATDRSI